MKIRITQIKLPVDHSREDLRQKTAKVLKVPPERIGNLTIRRQSLDARKKPELYYSYTVDADCEMQEKQLHKLKNPQVSLCREESYRFPKPGEGTRSQAQRLTESPVIIGMGPAGLFCGLMLARAGYRPVLLERGEDVDARKQTVEHFWETGKLDLRSNVQFGEGGAGTFSDGKLNTLVKDPRKLGQFVLETFCEFGANSQILYQSKPHIGTDVLAGIVKSMRQEILRRGGEVRFCCRVRELKIREGRVCGVETETGEVIPAQAVVLAIGHSARDTFQMLYERQIPMSAKAFAVGLRIQHPQSMINRSQYGREQPGELGAANYKLTRQTGGGRGVYSFCMCPGGYVVNASSEDGRLAVNGMSYHGRAGENANSALIVTVTPEDFADDTPLGGIRFQQQLEEKAFRAAGGRIPIQLYEDYRNHRISKQLGEVSVQVKGQWNFADVRSLMPEPLNLALIEAMEGFGRVIKGFDRPDSVLAGIESRTSSPVRIWRDEELESAVRGLYPCGEGAGYAGGITSAAMDGIRTAEAIVRHFLPGMPEQTTGGQK